MTIDTLEAIQAGGTTQWIRIRGADAANPVVLLIQHRADLSLAAMTCENVSLDAPQEAAGEHEPGTGQVAVAAAGGRPLQAAGEQSQDEPLVSGEDDEDLPAVRVAAAGATADPVRDYLKQIGKVALLNAGQEVALAKRIEAGLFADHKLAEGSGVLSVGQSIDLEQVAEDGRLAKNHLVEANLRLVVSLARRYTGRGMLFLDLIQEGNLGLIRAVEKFDYTRGYKFSTCCRSSSTRYSARCPSARPAWCPCGSGWPTASPRPLMKSARCTGSPGSGSARSSPRPCTSCATRPDPTSSGTSSADLPDGRQPKT